jgi:hypothetical protein
VNGTRGQAVSFGDRRRPAGPVYRSIVVIDLEGSTMRSNPAKGELRHIMYTLLERALAAAAIAGEHLEPMHDRGDGVLVLVRPHDDVPKTVLLNRLIPLLARLLEEYNAQITDPELRMRLRAVVHAGEVHSDSRAFYGEAIDVAVRLLDAAPVKMALRQTAQPLVLVVSEEIYRGIVVHGYAVCQTYRPLVLVSVNDRTHRGWVHIPAPTEPPGAVIRRLPVPPVTTHKIRTARAMPPRNAMAGGRRYCTAAVPAAARR